MTQLEYEKKKEFLRDFTPTRCSREQVISAIQAGALLDIAAYLNAISQHMAPNIIVQTPTPRDSQGHEY